MPIRVNLSQNPVFNLGRGETEKAGGFPTPRGLRKRKAQAPPTRSVSVRVACPKDIGDTRRVVPPENALGTDLPELRQAEPTNNIPSQRLGTRHKGRLGTRHKPMSQSIVAN
ncbi:hypothetical protein SAMD00079811_27050 [Scytonema sp. HK-05]|uniref:hypothetical protein n=1 Tax=Scytonema sp. HK-05 TaxID=1137095 RepID=UPI000937D9B5|nr:hypothetical protein [Scytonema sp. HK-05]OKH60801.1 hypothetical protein NIES2130_01585 [Scytonema sp. HK-05]BAY45103.1 hypothetical protein SAMD00079811_27050 [Scytonema sp. HK-05]